MTLALGTNSGFVTTAPTTDPAETGVTLDGNALVTKDTSPSDAATITEIGFYRASGSTSVNIELGIYSESGGAADALLYSVEFTSAASGWLSQTVDWAISPSTAYWLAVQMDQHVGSSTIDRRATDGSGSDTITGPITALPDPFGGGAVNVSDGMLSLYAITSAASAKSGQFTRLALSATPQSNYGSFAGKSSGGIPVVLLIEGGMLTGGFQPLSGGM